jgi:uncharacterized membrane protein
MWTSSALLQTNFLTSDMYAQILMFLMYVFIYALLKMIKIDRNTSDLSQIVCLNIMLTSVQLLFLLFELFTKSRMLVNLRLLSFTNLVLDGSGWSTPRPGCFIPWKQP